MGLSIVVYSAIEREREVVHGVIVILVFWGVPCSELSLLLDCSHFTRTETGTFHRCVFCSVACLSFSFPVSDNAE